MRTITVELTDGTIYERMRLMMTDNGGPVGMNFAFMNIDNATGTVYRNETAIRSLTWVEDTEQV
jgi:hypothetical protein